MRHISQDFRYAWRRLRRQPAFALTAIVMLGLGVGSVATLFSVMNGALLRPVALPEMDRLIGIARANDAGRRGGVSYPDFVDVRDAGGGVFASIAAFRNWQGTFSGIGRAETLHGEVISGDYFRTLGIVPAAGRFLGASDDGPDATGLVISHRLWLTWFGGRTDALGAAVKVAGRPFTIVGVAPEGFRGLSTPTLLHADVWLPLQARVDGRVRASTLTERNVPELRTIARLLPDADVPRAEAMLDAVSARLQDAWAASPSKHLRGMPLHALVMPSDFQTAGFGIGAAVVGLAVLVLLISCGNIAHLTLAHAFGRAGELAIRASTGASRWRLFRLLLTETTLLVAIAGAGGLVVASTLAHALSTVVLPPMDGMQLAPDIRPDWRVFGFTLLVVALTTIATGLVPAWRASGLPPARVIAGSGSAGGHATSRGRMRTLLVSAQVAVSMALLLVAAALLQSVRASLTFDRGFETSHQAMMRVDLASHGLDETRGQQLLTRLRDAAARLPGVDEAALFDRFPTTTYGAQRTFSREADAAAQRSTARTFVVSPEYFSVIRLPILAGRGFDARDTMGAPRVAVISTALARHLWPEGAALGQRISREAPSGGSTGTVSYEVVGVTDDIGVYGREARARVVWTPAAQTYLPTMGVVVRTREDPRVAVEQLRGALGAIDDSVAPLEAQPLETHVENVIVLTRLAGVVLASLAVVALTISLVGLYAIVAHYVGTRTREIGIRMAIGATAREVRWMVHRQTLRFLMYGVVPGAIAAWGAGAAMHGLVFGIERPNVVMFAVMGASLVCVGLAATLLPARRAARVDPIRALRAL